MKQKMPPNTCPAFGKPLIAFIPECYRTKVRKRLIEPDIASNSGIIGETRHPHGVKNDGSEFPVEHSIAIWKEDEETYYRIRKRKHVHLHHTPQCLKLSHARAFKYRSDDK